MCPVVPTHLFSTPPASRRYGVWTVTRRFLSLPLSCCLALLMTMSLEAEEKPSEQSFDLLSYNIRYANPGDGQDVWSERRDRVAEVIRGADVAGLQEVTTGQLKDLQQRCPDFSWYAVGRTDGKQDGESCAIAFRKDRYERLEAGTFWLSPTPDVVGSKGWDAALPRIASWVRLRDRHSKADWLVVNTHLDHRGSQARHESARLIQRKLQSLAKGDPVVVTGDFNARPDSAPLQAFTAAGDKVHLQDSRDLSDTAAEGPSGTWNGFKAIDDKVRIDYVLVGDRVRVKTHRTLNPKTAAGRFASDHLPVLVTLSPQAP